MGKRDPELEMLLELAVPAGLPIAPAHLTALPAPSKPFNLHIYSGWAALYPCPWPALQIVGMGRAEGRV